MVATDAAAMSAIRYIQAAAVAFLLLAIFAAYQYAAGLSQKAKVSMLQSQLVTCQSEFAVQAANNHTLMASIQRQNEALTVIKAEAEGRRRAALKARDEALRALDEVSSDYAALRDDWPADCVSAVDRVRIELGL